MVSLWQLANVQPRAHREGEGTAIHRLAAIGAQLCAITE